MMRLSPSGNRKFIQASHLEFYFGGTELNVGLSIAHFGGNVKHITCLSDDFIGDTALSYLNKFDLDTTAVIRSKRPLGVYFLEVGAVMRPSSISYNRSHSAFSEIEPNMVNWDAALENGSWFHWTGITPALTKGSLDTLKEGLKLAREKGMQVSADPTYRSGLWNYGVDPKDALTELLHCSTVFIGGINEMNEVLGTNFGYSNDEFIEASKLIIEKFPSIVKVFDKIRTSINSSPSWISSFDIWW